MDFCLAEQCSYRITASWTAPTDLSGIAQYAVKVDQTATTLPATTDAPQAGTSATKTVAADGVWYLHVRAKDSAGNWADVAGHFKFQVNSALPAAPVVASSTHPDQNAAYTAGSFSGEWTPPAADTVGYSVVLDANPATVAATTVTTTGTTHTATVAEGVWYLHVRAKNNAGTWGATSHFRFTVDSTAPVLPGVSSTEYPAELWAGGPNQSGQFVLSANGSADVVSYLYGLDTDPPVTSASAPTPGQDLAVEVIPATEGPHTLYVRSVDTAGNQSPVKAYLILVGANGGKMSRWTGPPS